MTCKDCIHYKRCKQLGVIYLFSAMDGAEKNDCFKDKSRFIELPCKVGDTVYFVEEQFGCNSEECSICDCQGEFEFHYRYRKCPVVCTIKIAEHKMRTINDIFRWYSYFGKTVFPTKEEAVKALKEWKNNE